MFEYSKIFSESWNVAWRKKAPGSILSDLETPFTLVKNSKRYWAADPFLFEHKGQTYIFAELYDYIRCRGVIGYCTIDSKGKTKWKPVIIENYHLSFPNIFCDDKDIYIMPESNESDSLYLYKAIDFPDKWEKERVLRENIKVVDTTILINDNTPYALTYQIDIEPQAELRVLDLKHPGKDYNPKLEHQELRRPAGKVLENLKIRAAQNCAEGYGKGLVFYQYHFVNQEYSEKELKKLYPEEIELSEAIYLDGMHTYNFSEHYEVIDIKTRRLNLLNLFMRVFCKLKR